MDTSTYEQWWALHLRVSRGNGLSVVERAAYEDGRKELHDVEVLTEDLSGLRQAREDVMELDARCETLHARRQQLKRNLSRLETALTEETRRNLGIKD